jgi:hypothetical protein
MIVIARIKSISKHVALEEEGGEAEEEECGSNNPFGLDHQETYFLCQIEKLEHIVGFDGDDYSFTDYACK